MTGEIIWEESLSNAVKLARDEDKLVLAAFFSPACEACIRMKKCTLITESVKEYIKKYFVPLKYESGRDADQFLRFGVSAKPAFLVLDSEGNEVFRKIGYFDPDLFIGKLEKARKKAAHRAAKK